MRSSCYKRNIIYAERFTDLGKQNFPIVVQF